MDLVTVGYSPEAGSQTWPVRVSAIVIRRANKKKAYFDAKGRNVNVYRQK
jgi:hypothetical protein